MKSYVLLSICLFATPAFSTTEILLTTSGAKFSASTGSAAPIGTVIRVGQFDLSDGNDLIIRNSGNFADVDRFFTPFAEGIAGAGSVSQDGNSRNTLIVNESDGGTFGFISGISDSYLAGGTPIHLWVLDDATSPAEWGIFASPEWANEDEPGAGFGSSVNVLTDAENITALRGEFSSGELRLQAVPEPSSGFLIGLAGLVLIVRRRR